MKKILSLILSVIMIISAGSMVALADDHPTPENAIDVTVGTHLQRRYLYQNNVEYYKFTLTEQTNIKATIEHVPMFRKFTLDLLSSSFELIDTRYGYEADALEMTVSLDPGTYYLKLTSQTERYRAARTEPGELFFDFSLEEATNYIGVRDEYEPNNTFDDATMLYFGMGSSGSSTVTANLHDSADKDYYYFGSEDPFHLDLTTTSTNVEIQIYDGDTMIQSGYGSISMDLNGGYYVKIVHDPEMTADFFNLNYGMTLNVTNL